LKERGIFLLCAALCTLPVFAQEAGEWDEGEGGGWDEDMPVTGGGLESDWNATNFSLYDKGNQTFNISVGAVIPTIFTDFTGGKAANMQSMPANLSSGGTGRLSYNYFLSRHLFLGGELSGMFAKTRAENYLFIVPLGLRFGAQVWTGRFEFPFAIMAGGASQSYLGYYFFDLFLKPEASVYFRFNNDWSFGVNAAWWMVFQGGTIFGDAKIGETSHNSLGQFLEITVGARYHF